jgi:hypothetical protein
MAKVEDFFYSNHFYIFFNIDLERMPTIFNQLLTILKHIIETYRLTDSIDILEYAAKLIHLLQSKNLMKINLNLIIISRSSFIRKYKLQS